MSSQLTPSTSVAWYWPSPPAEGELHTHCKDLAPTLLCKSHHPDPIPGTSGKLGPGLEPEHRQGPPPRPGNRQPGVGSTTVNEIISGKTSGSSELAFSIAKTEVINDHLSDL